MKLESIALVNQTRHVVARRFRSAVGRRIAAFLTATVLASGSMLPAHAESERGVDLEHRNHFAVVTTGSHLFVEDEADKSAFTIGGDYEYRINRILGAGFVLEHAFGELDATTLLGVADIHIWRGFALQAGGGVEWADHESNAVGRIGGVYEFELARGFTIAPQVHYDFSKEDTLVFGAAFGRAF